MANQLITEDQVKNALNISSFRNLSKDKIMEFVSLLPNMDKEVAISCINQFPSFVDLSKEIINSLINLCDVAVKENKDSQSETIQAYKLILTSEKARIERGNLSKEDEDRITENMLMIADKISAKDSEQKQFLKDVLHYGSNILVGILIVGAGLLGFKGQVKLPSLNRKA